MKLIRFGDSGEERPGVLLESGGRKDCSAWFKDYDRDFFNGGGFSELTKQISQGVDKLPDVPDGVRWAAPVARPGKIVGIGLNYEDHAKETETQLPSEPIIFLKSSHTIVGPYDDVLIPRGSEKTDWEVELGVVIGKDARYLATPRQAIEHVAGYTISNDLSERAYQHERGGQWTKGKSCDTFNPLGPFVATADEVRDVRNLSLTLDLNGERMQDGNTGQMIFDVFFLVHYLSQFFTLEAGDVITTGTPAGVGMARKPQRFLTDGDELVLAVSHLGEQRQKVKQG